MHKRSEGRGIPIALKRKVVDKRKCPVPMCHCYRETGARRQMNGAPLSSRGQKKFLFLKFEFLQGVEGELVGSHSFGLSSTELDFDLCLDNSVYKNNAPPKLFQELLCIASRSEQLRQLKHDGFCQDHGPRHLRPKTT